MCLAVISAPLPACSAPSDPTELHLAQTNGAYESDEGNSAAPASTSSAEPQLSAALPANDDADQCPSSCVAHSSCGQICIALKGRGSSCQLAPTANDLTRLPRGVYFDCDELTRGPNGWDFDALGHITLMGDACDSMQKSGPHRITLALGCPPPPSP